MTDFLSQAQPSMGQAQAQPSMGQVQVQPSMGQAQAQQSTGQSQHTQRHLKKKRKLVIVNRCGICMTDHDNKHFKKIKCEYCTDSACISCCETYILTQRVITCMNIYCKREWSSDYISSVFSKSFLNGEYKKHYQNILLDKERVTFPETVECIRRLDEIESELNKYEEQNEIEKKRRNDILLNDKIEREIQSTRNMIYVLEEQIKKDTQKDTKNEKRKKENIERISLLEKNRQLLAEFYIKHNELNESIYQYNRDLNYIDRLTLEKEDIQSNGKLSTTKYNIKKCPGENCRGFLDIQFVCGICNCKACDKCHELKGDEHKCNQDTVKTIDLMIKDTKSCPNCFTNINKIDGCDQMWCTLCHTAFSWTTGVIEKKIHNPHYYQWMRSQSANGEIAREDDNQQAAEELYCNEQIDHLIRVNKSCYIVYLFRDVYLPRLEMIEQNSVKTRFIKKCLFLQNKITEKTYKIFLEKNAYEKKAHDEFTSLVTMFTNVLIDMLHSMIRIKKDTNNELNNYHFDNEAKVEFANIFINQLDNIKLKYTTLNSKLYSFLGDIQK